MILSNSFKNKSLKLCKVIFKNTFFLTLPVFLLAIVFIIFNIKNNLEIVSSFIEGLSMELIPYLTIVFMLQFINWTLEAVKLKILLPHDKLNFQHILKSIYVGNLTALLTPKRLGNFIGRKWFIKEKSDHIISATLCGNIIQLFTTILMALISFIYLLNNQMKYLEIVDTNLYLFSFIYGLVSLILCYLIFNNKWHRLFKNINFGKFSFRYLKNLSNIRRLNTLGVSILRYLIFILQYYILFIGFEIPITILATTIMVGLLFGFVTFIPSLAPGNLGTREAISILLLGGSIVGIQFSIISFLVWFINVAISSLIGGLIILKTSRK
jgi:hypothetical protein